MSERHEIVIIGAGPGGIAAAVKAQEAGKSYVVLEKGSRVLQGVIDSYPKGKKVYPTIPKYLKGPFPIDGLTPPPEKIPVEDYVEQVEDYVESLNLNIRYNEEYQDLDETRTEYRVRTSAGSYFSPHVIFAFGSNIPNDLGIYGEAKTVRRNLENPQDYLGITTLVIGGGNAAADVVAALSKVKREANDATPVYWGHIKEKFEINKDTARDLGEEILLGGQIKILQGAVPKIGEVDAEGIDRLYIHQSPGAHGSDDVFMYQGMSFPMKNVIACIGTHGPSAIFNQLDLQQITCTGEICRIAREGEQLLLLSSTFQTSRKGIYAIGGSISPSYMEIQPDRTIKEKRHSNLIFTAIVDGITAMEGILGTRSAPGDAPPGE
jgi:thioredoxin reductase